MTRRPQMVLTLAQLRAGTAVLARRANMSRRRVATVAGRKRMAAYAEALERAAVRRAADEAMAIPMELLIQAVEEAPDAETAQRKVLEIYRGRLSATGLARIMEKTLILSHCAGKAGAAEDL